MRDTQTQHLQHGSAELFPTDAPVPSSRMIGRARDVDEVATALAGGANLVLAGPRRTGKTSVADAALEVVAAEGCATVAVDLFLHADADELAEAIALAAIATRPVLRRAVESAGRNARRLRDALSATATLRARQDLGDELEVALSLATPAAAPERRLRAALELLERIGASDDRRVVVFLDEFQDVASGRFGDPDVVTRQMRAVLQRSPHVSVLFAGSVEHLMRELFAPGERALSQFGSLHELHEITVAEWEAGLRARFAEDGRSIGDEALAQLISAGEGHPRATMLIAQQTHQAAVLALERDIDAALVAEGGRRALAADRLKHEQTLERIRSLGRGRGRGVYQTVARRVARGEPLYEGLAPQVARRALQALRDAGIAERAGREWRIIDPLLRRFLAEL